MTVAKGVAAALRKHFQVDFDDLMARLGRYRPAERAALDAWRDETCRIRGGADPVESTPAVGGR